MYKMIASTLLLLLLLPLHATATAPLPVLSIEPSSTSVSGLSSGAAMAIQLHIAFSKTFMGIGAMAGPPYYCAHANAITAQTSCMTTPSLIDVDNLVQITKNTAATGTADPISNLRNARVWLFSGKFDTVVDPGVVKKVETYYGHFVDEPGNVKAVFDVPSEHALPTLDYGNACSYRGSPYIGNCSYDAAGALMQHIYNDTLSPPSNCTVGKLLEFSQQPFVPLGYSLTTAALYGSGFVYIPSKCADAQNPCKLHVALHGCEQTVPQIGTQYYTNSGLNRWAEQNMIVILYPQAKVTTLNPKGCWDWWGYSGVQYASKLGAQMQAIHKMVSQIQGHKAGPGGGVGRQALP
jgi:poly(3-hydroxybutyrate) depolymerase